MDKFAGTSLINLVFGAVLLLLIIAACLGVAALALAVGGP